MANFVLHDENITKHASSGSKDGWGDRNLGKCVVAQALDQGAIAKENEGIDYNPTGVNGYINNIFYSLVFEAGKDAWKRKRVDEWIETSHASPEYHQMISGQKGAYEEKIKQTLAGISQSVADLELLEHDIRKYKEYEDYLKDLNNKDATAKRKAMFAMKTIFVDQVDFHAGGGGQGAGRLSLAFMRNNNIMPTIVNDFIEMESLNDIREGGKFANLADVEKKMLESKWTLYEHWLTVFQSTIDNRLQRLETLKRSREYTIDQYRDWVKPTIGRYRMISTGFARLDKRKFIKEMFYTSIGQGISWHGWTTWIYKPMSNPELHTTPGEVIALAVEAGEYGKPFAFDKWTQDNLIYNPDHGVVSDFPWLRKGWIEKRVEGISKELEKKQMTMYTSFMRLDVWKTANKMVQGTIFEDADFICNMYVLSANAMLAKLLELDAKTEELNRYIDRILGLKPDMENYDGIIVGYKKKGKKYTVEWVGGEDSPDKKIKPFNSREEMEKEYPSPKYYLTPIIPLSLDKLRKEDPVLDFKIKLGLDGWFFKKRGPYEHQFHARMTKFYFKFSGQRFESLCSIILNNMKIEEP